MASFIIEGGHRLNGDLIPQGAKNEALEVLCYTVDTRRSEDIQYSRYTRCK